MPRAVGTVVAMKVGVLQFFSWPERRVPLDQVYARALDRIVVMDQTGYDAVWLAEHHFTTYSVCPSVHLMALEAAHRTNRLRIGTAVSLAALYHPLRLAEELALLDVLIGGRLNWGAGRGFEPAEFAAFGVPHDETAPRFREAVEIVLEAWTTERLTFHGKFWAFDGVEVLPKPMQQPHPPTWVAATSLDAIGWAASVGHPILMDPHASFAEIAAKYDQYVGDLAVHGFPAPTDTPMARLLAVAATDEEAEDIARTGAAWTIGAYAHDLTPGPGPREVQQSADVAERIEGYVRDRIIWGSPARVRDELARLAEEMRLHYLMIAPLSHDSFVRFTDDVLPHLTG
jgi:alkanesulfonate monooxygenase SsuD/methylene tetrahydromethanopterin reductase-like flavin-dependent oxidoreductase (luciferase family)